MKSKFEIIGFDADDTLWVNQPNYDLVEDKFCELLTEYKSKDELSEILYSIEVKNIEMYGYGAKSFMLSMIETALKICSNTEIHQIIDKIIQCGKELISIEVELLDGVLETLDFFQKKNSKIILITKGDLIDQERKLKKSNLEKYFHHIEILSNKTVKQYRQLLSQLEIAPADFLMIGNSMRSDIEPVLDIGGNAIYVPYHTTWIHEDSKKIIDHPNLIEIKKINEVIDILK